MNKTELLKQLNTYEIDCSEEQLDLLMLLMESTLSENEKFNLTAIKDRDQFVEKMIFDSAIGLRDLDLFNKSIIDVGTGAGFPGMVIRILAKNANVTLLDSTKKKIDYLIIIVRLVVLVNVWKIIQEIIQKNMIMPVHVPSRI